MPSIQDLLENLGVEDSAQEKTASAEANFSDQEIEKAAAELGLISKNETETTEKVASQNTGENMNLTDLYDAYFGEESEKTASANVATEQELEKTAAEILETAGENAGVAFSNSLENRLFKFAMNQEMESAATEARDGSSQVAVPGNVAASPQLEQNKPAEAKAGLKMDLTPVHADMKDAAKAKAAILKALATNDTDGVEGVSSVDVGLETPNSQKDA